MTGRVGIIPSVIGHLIFRRNRYAGHRYLPLRSLPLPSLTFASRLRALAKANGRSDEIPYLEVAIPQKTVRRLSEEESRQPST